MILKYIDVQILRFISVPSPDLMLACGMRYHAVVPIYILKNSRNKSISFFSIRCEEKLIYSDYIDTPVLEQKIDLVE